MFGFFGWFFAGILITGLVLAFNGVVQLCVRKKTGPWKEGGASLLAGAIIVGVWIFAGWLTGTLVTELLSTWPVLWWSFLVAGLVLLFNGVVQLSVRKKTGPWKEGGASLLAGAIMVGVPVFVERLTRMWLDGTMILGSFLIAGLVLALNGVAQLCVRKKTGSWKEGDVNLLAGAILVGASFFMMVLAVLGELPHGFGFMVVPFMIAGLVLALNSAVQLSVREKTGPWKEGGASLLAGAIMVGVSIGVLVMVGMWFLPY